MAAKAADPDLEFIAAGLDDSLAKIRDIEMHYTYGSLPEGKDALSCVWLQKGQKEYVERSPADGGDKDIVSYDGTVTRRLRGRQAVADIAPALRRRYFAGFATPAWFLSFEQLTDEPVVLSMRRPGTRLLKPIQEEQGRCYPVHIAINDRAWVVWHIEPSRDYRAVRIERVWGGGNARATHTIELAEFDGTWLPKKDAKQGRSTYGYQLLVTRAFVNRGIPDSRFRPTFPVGTDVFDEVGGTRYRMGSAEDIVDGIVHNWKKQQLPKAADLSGSAVESQIASSERSVPALLVVAMGLLCVAVIVVVRRQLRRKEA